MNLASLEAELKAGLAKVEHLLYTPQTQHPLLEDLRQLLARQIQEHLSSVASSAAALGNSVLQQVEQALNPSTAASSAKPAAPTQAPVAATKE